MTTLRRHSVPAMKRHAKYKHVIADLRKNSAERLGIQLEEYNRANLLSIIVRRNSTGRHSLRGMNGTARSVSILNLGSVGLDKTADKANKFSLNHGNVSVEYRTGNRFFANCDP